LLVTLRNWKDRARLAISGFATKCFETTKCEEETAKIYFQDARMSTKAFGRYLLYFSYKVKATPYAAIGRTLGPHVV
jgi:hypothetical protein